MFTNFRESSPSNFLLAGSHQSHEKCQQSPNSNSSKILNCIETHKRWNLNQDPQISNEGTDDPSANLSVIQKLHRLQQSSSNNQSPTSTASSPRSSPSGAHQQQRRPVFYYKSMSKFNFARLDNHPAFSNYYTDKKSMSDEDYMMMRMDFERNGKIVPDDEEEIDRHEQRPERALNVRGCYCQGNCNCRSPSQSHQFKLQLFSQARTPSRSPAQPQKFCTHCWTNGKSPKKFTSHTMRDERGLIYCQDLRRIVCLICGATGDHAHALNDCPHHKFNNNIFTMQNSLINLTPNHSSSSIESRLP